MINRMNTDAARNADARPPLEVRSMLCGTVRIIKKKVGKIEGKQGEAFIIKTTAFKRQFLALILSPNPPAPCLHHFHQLKPSTDRHEDCQVCVFGLQPHYLGVPAPTGT